MKKSLRIFCGLFVATCVATDVMATTGTPRSTVNPENVRSANTVSRGRQPVLNARSGASRVARNVVSRTAIDMPNRSDTPSTMTRARNVISDAGNAIINRAFGLNHVARIAATPVRATTNARVAAVPSGASRSRATAVFSDVSKLGDGYNQCRDAYNTCMDQFCANMNDTYRRCFCSNTFQVLRDRENALDAATTMLAQFENNNLNAVSLSADEVNAMYSATTGEAAIKKDTSASAALLNDIGDLLSGKKKPEQNQSITSLTGLTVDFSADFDDIWGANTNSLFADNSHADLSSLEGIDLYNNAHNQCMQLIGDACQAGAIKNMTKSAYNVLITQDCNAYQKKLDQKTEQIKSTVRTAEKYLREARLEEYRSHNSADVNECMDKVETALKQSTACGSNYEKCMDYTGLYINSTTGEPIYSTRLFKLNEIIVLDGSADVLTQNPEFNNFLESKRMYAKTALDSCRNIADTVWTEFKRNALIQISQAQDEKIEEVKMSCVSTMKDCYDTQSGALKGFDDTTAQASGALAARASSDMCSDKVMACAALYGDPDGCRIDTKTNKITNASSTKKCGLQSLLNFVNTVDDVRVAEGCGTAVENYLKQLCTPTAGEEGYPWNCRLHKFGTMPTSISTSWDVPTNLTTGSSLIQRVTKYAADNCVGTGTTKIDEPRVQEEIVRQLENLQEQLGDIIGQKCETSGGIWVDASTTGNSLSDGTVIDSFYSVNFGKDHTKAQTDYGVDSWGKCIQNTVKARCAEVDKKTGSNGYATYDDATGICNLTVEYYKYQCEQVMGIWTDDNNCYVEK